MTGRAKLVPVDKQAVSTSSIDWGCSSNVPSKLGERQLAKTGLRASDARYILSSFILRVALDCTETKLLDKLAAQVQDNHLRGTNLFRLDSDLIPVFLLAHISKKADDFISLVKEPAQNAAGVKTTCAMLFKIR